MNIKKEEITFDDGTVVTLRQPLVKDMKNVAKVGSEAEVEMTLIANLTETSPSELENWTMLDYGKVQEKLRDFLPNGL